MFELVPFYSEWCSKCSGSGYRGWTDTEWLDDELNNYGGVHHLIFGGEQPQSLGGVDEFIVTGYLDATESHSLDSMYPEVDVVFEIEMICIPEDVLG